MLLRKSLALKVLALLLFTVELLAPALVTNQGEIPNEQTNIQATHNHSFLLSLFAEEAGSEEGQEREGKDQKLFLGFDFHNSASLYSFFITHDYGSVHFNSDSHPLPSLPFFKLYRIYRI